MTTTEAAAVLGISLRTVQAHIKSGQLKATKHGRDWLITQADLDDFQQHKRPAHRPTTPKE